MSSHNTTGLCGDRAISCLQWKGRCEEQHQSQVKIDMLPDDVLLEIFDFYREGIIDTRWIYPWRWKILIQVCRRWRCVIFGSPRRLKLQIVCTNTTPTRTSLAIWPPFPIHIACVYIDEKSVENVIAAVELGHDRVLHISIDNIKGSALEKLATAMQQPLPALTSFSLISYDWQSVPVLSETFLGSAPRLKLFILQGVPFPTFPQFILSCTHICYLRILDIPDSGYISPNAMVACLAALPNLEFLHIGFGSPLSRPPQITPPPRIRIVLPALTELLFIGVSEYLEDFVARIDTPLLDTFDITFFMDLNFEIPQLGHFIRRAGRLEPLDQARMTFDDDVINVEVSPRFWLQIRCEFERPDWQLSLMVQIFSQLLSHVEQLEICQSSLDGVDWTDPDMDSSPWLELFHLFIALQRLYVSEELVTPVAAALQELTEGGTMGVLPALQSLFLQGPEPSGPVPEGVQSFVAARQLSDHHIAVQRWNRS